jgi:hypothetical protein
MATTVVAFGMPERLSSESSADKFPTRQIRHNHPAAPKQHSCLAKYAGDLGPFQPGPDQARRLYVNRASTERSAIAGNAAERHGPAHTMLCLAHHGSRTTAQGPGRPFRWLDWIDGGSGSEDQRAWFLRLALGLGFAQTIRSPNVLVKGRESVVTIGDLFHRWRLDCCHSTRKPINVTTPASLLEKLAADKDSM